MTAPAPRQVKPPVSRQQAGPQGTVPSQHSQGYGPWTAFDRERGTASASRDASA